MESSAKENQENYSEKDEVKLVFLGDMDVGKTACILTYVNDEFP